MLNNRYKTKIYLNDEKAQIELWAINKQISQEKCNKFMGLENMTVFKKNK